MFQNVEHVVIPVINKTEEEQCTPTAQIEVTYHKIEVYHCKIKMSE
jgi:hypothetical protein